MSDRASLDAVKEFLKWLVLYSERDELEELLYYLVAQGLQASFEEYNNRSSTLCDLKGGYESTFRKGETTEVVIEYTLKFFREGRLLVSFMAKYIYVHMAVGHVACCLHWSDKPCRTERSHLGFLYDGNAAETESATTCSSIASSKHGANCESCLSWSRFLHAVRKKTKGGI